MFAHAQPTCYRLMDDKPQQPIPKEQANPPASTPGSQLPVAQDKNEPSFLEFFAKSVSEVTEAITHTATHTGKSVVETASGLGEAAAKQTYQLISQATQGAGHAVNQVSDNWLVRRVNQVSDNWIVRRFTGVLNFDWLLGATNRVDLDKAMAAVRKLQQEHPNESPSQIAHRIIIDKSIYAGGVGLVTSLVPGEAIALLAVDLATTTLMQAEMVYQIAAAYGLDLKEPSRKGEVLAIFGLTFGGSRAIKAGLGLLRNVPVAGAVIGASANATMFYSLGYAACRFYEAKLNDETTEAKLEEVKVASENYLEVAIAQQAIMDQILAHMILASHPEKSWSQILPDLQALNLTPTSLEVIATNIKSPQPLDTLLDQLNRDFAVPLLAQCYRIAQIDGETTPAEAKVIAAISTKFNIDELNAATAVAPDM